MGEFFGPIRRKIGCVTLLMAIVLVGPWVRSLSTMDTFAFSHLPKEFLFVSVDGAVGWQTVRETDIRSLFGKFRWHSQKSRSIHEIFNRAESLKKWYWNGFGVMQLDDSTTLGCLPYWSIVTPLTFISLWLLLTKPRQSTRKNATEPIISEGA